MRARLGSRSFVATAIAMMIAAPAVWANEPPIEVFLIPIIASHAPDSGGALWNSTVSFNFASSKYVSVISFAVVDPRALLPGERGTLQFHPIRPSGYGPGVLLLAQGDFDQLSLQEYVYNEAKPEVGVSIPCVRRSDLGGPIRLIGIPVVAGARTLVRIYGISDAFAENVRVRVFDASGQRLAEDIVHLVPAPLSPLNETPDQPAYAEYRPAVDPATYSSISIDIESPVAGGAIWAFSTTTGPHSASVTAVFPAR